MLHKSAILVVISVLVVTLIYGSFAPVIVFAERPDPGWWGSTNCGSWGGGTGVKATWCCWYEGKVQYCQTCVPITEGPDKGEQECTTKEKQSLEQPPTPPPFGPLAPLQDGVLEQPPTPPPSGPAAPLQGGVLEQLEQGKVTPGFVPGFLQRQEQPPPDQGAAELSPPATVEEEPVPPCPEGQVLDEETNLCVLEEPEATEEPAQSEPEEENQPSEESDSGEDSNN